MATVTKPPWIPPGTNSQKSKKTQKHVTKNQDVLPIKKSPEKNFVERKEEEKEEEDDLILISSNSSAGKNIFMCTLYQEMKLIYTHFTSVKTSYLSLHRLIDFQSVEDTCINELLSEIGSSLKDFNKIFEDFEKGICVLENTLNEDQKLQKYSKVFKIKEKLLSKLFELNEKVIIIFRTIFEKKDFKELSELQVSLNRKLQSKTNLSAKELEKELFYKESEIKYLRNELLNSSLKQAKPNHEDSIEIMKTIIRNADRDKSALKKALKFKNIQSKKTEEKYQKLVEESNEKEKIMYELAAQRDELKVQLTKINNQVIEQKIQIERIELQNIKLQKEMEGKDISHTNEVTALQNTLQKKLESKDVHLMFEEMQRLSSLLQRTTEVFVKRNSIPVVSAGGDNTAKSSSCEAIFTSLG